MYTASNATSSRSLDGASPAMRCRAVGSFRSKDRASSAGVSIVICRYYRRTRSWPAAWGGGCSLWCAHTGSRSTSPERTMVLGLRPVIYPVPDLQRAKAWYSSAFGVQPYFDEPFYVGFNIGGFELGLDPDTKGVKPGPGGSVAYWKVPKIDDAVQGFTKAGAKLKAPIQDVGEDIKVATVADPFRNLIGLI